MKEQFLKSSLLKRAPAMGRGGDTELGHLTLAIISSPSPKPAIEIRVGIVPGECALLDCVRGRTGGSGALHRFRGLQPG